MRLRDLKDALQGAHSKNERYEEALRHILLACLACNVHNVDDCVAMRSVVEEKCKNMLEGLDKR